VTPTSSGNLDQALPIFRSVFSRESRWIDVVPRLAPSGLLPDDEELIDKILAQAKKNTSNE